MKLCSRGRLLGVRPKSYNVPERLGMGKLMSIKHGQLPIGVRHFGEKNSKTKP